MGYSNMEKMPKAVKSSDASGEKSAKMVGGVAMGKADGPIRAAMGKHDGRMGEMKGSCSETVCYEHKRSK